MITSHWQGPLCFSSNWVHFASNTLNGFDLFISSEHNEVKCNKDTEAVKNLEREQREGENIDGRWIDLDTFPLTQLNTDTQPEDLIQILRLCRQQNPLKAVKFSIQVTLWPPVTTCYCEAAAAAAAVDDSLNTHTTSTSQTNNNTTSPVAHTSWGQWKSAGVVNSSTTAFLCCRSDCRWVSVSGAVTDSCTRSYTLQTQTHQTTR